ncbi:hypothetical protein Golax_000528 [Gossypium laxum]|uniref:Uncharacterized protein n=1 Tax=Gossypium laxum TaxID=34288 RepID=A0A7J9AU84_9ROSI|nr:hypothetical protein [Gossypium laxum]
MTLINWQSVCQPKASGGLGIQQLKEQNISFMLKLGCNILTNIDSLWVRVIKSKYKVEESLPAIIKQGKCSFFLESSFKDLAPPLRKYYLDKDLFRVWLPDEVLNRIVSIPPTYPSVGVDRVSWMGTLTGSFSIKSAYKTIKKNLWNLKDETWKISWKGILRDNHGEWIIGFCRQLGKCLMLDAELWGILDGLSLVQEK